MATMDVDPDEEARFRAALATLPSEEIQRRLDNNTIMRDWKRKLAEGEVARRANVAQATRDRTVRDAETARRGKRQMARQVWIVMGLAMAAAVIAIWTLVPR